MGNNHEVKVTGGIGIFFFSLIPWALSLGVAGWLAFAAGVRDEHQRSEAEKRVATAVGEKVKPTAPYKLVLEQRHFFIDSARYDGHSLEMYYRNNGHVRLYNYCFHYKEKAADGTTINGHQECFPEDEKAMVPGERAELRENFDADSRTTKIVLGFDAPLEGDD